MSTEVCRQRASLSDAGGRMTDKRKSRRVEPQARPRSHQLSCDLALPLLGRPRRPILRRTCRAVATPASVDLAELATGAAPRIAPGTIISIGGVWVGVRKKRPCQT